MNEIMKELVLIISFLLVILIIIFIINFMVNMIMQTIFWYWVPFVPSTDYKTKKLIEILKIKKWQSFVDLWCWDWKILEAVKDKFPEALVYWIENSPKPYNLALKRRKRNNLDYNLIQNNFFKEDFSIYDIIYSFLIPYLMNKIWIKIKSECKPWTLFYVSEFEIKGEKFIDKIIIEEKDYKWKIFVYEV
jgi:hypothetical protein